MGERESTRYIQKNKVISTELAELEAFEKYEAPTDSGTYTKRINEYE